MAICRRLPRRPFYIVSSLFTLFTSLLVCGTVSYKPLCHTTCILVEMFVYQYVYFLRTRTYDCRFVLFFVFLVFSVVAVPRSSYFNTRERRLRPLIGPSSSNPIGCPSGGPRQRGREVLARFFLFCSLYRAISFANNMTVPVPVCFSRCIALFIWGRSISCTPMENIK